MTTTREEANRIKTLLEAEFPGLDFRTRPNHQEASAYAEFNLLGRGYLIECYGVAHCEEDLDGDADTPLPEGTEFEYHSHLRGTRPQHADTPEEIIAGLRVWADRILGEVIPLRKD